MKILIDMNLSPDWVVSLREAGFESVHWSHVGDPKASDETIMDYAKACGYGDCSKPTESTRRKGFC
jgi:predicted nuclease of predicted toxin-antitoxin system